jgi:serine protease Do
MSMMTRAKVAGAVMAAFIGGLGIATAFELPQSGFAQAARTVRTASGPRDDGGAPGFADVAERVTPAVVSIQVAKDAPRRTAARPPGNVPPGMEEFFRQYQGRGQREPMEGSGTGFLITPTGYILTNNHVVSDADRITVVLTDHREFSAKLIGRDPTTDVAVIKIEGSDLPTVAFGDDNAARIGSWVLAIGNPLGLNAPLMRRAGPSRISSRPTRRSIRATQVVRW